jgi:hypothetical protein
MSLSLAAVKTYYETLHEHGQLHFDHEGAVRRAFGDLLATCGRRSKPPLTLVTEYPIDRVRIRIDGSRLSNLQDAQQRISWNLFNYGWRQQSCELTDLAAATQQTGHLG